MGKSFDSFGFNDFLADLTQKFLIVSIEGGLDESDWVGWKDLTQKIGAEVQLFGDDLFVADDLASTHGSPL